MPEEGQVGRKKRTAAHRLVHKRTVSSSACIVAVGAGQACKAHTLSVQASTLAALVASVSVGVFIAVDVSPVRITGLTSVDIDVRDRTATLGNLRIELDHAFGLYKCYLGCIEICSSVHPQYPLLDRCYCA